MKLTSREKFLVGLLLIGVFVFVMFNYMITPTNEDIEALKVTKQEKELELAQMKGIINREQEFIDAFNLYNEKLFELSSDYYVDLRQEDMLVLLNNLNKSENLQIDNFDFSDNSSDNNVRNQMLVRFEYSGPYQEVYSYLDNLKNNDQYIQVSNLDINSSGDNEISGRIMTNFNSIPMVQAFTEGKSIFQIYGNLAQKQLDSPYTRYPSLAEKYAQQGEVSEDEMSQMEIYLKNRLVDPINGFDSSPKFFVGTDPEVTGNITQSPNRLYGQNSIQLDYNYGVRQVNTEANLVFEDNLIIKDPEEFVSLWVNPIEITGHEIGLVLVDALGESYDLSLAPHVDWKDWKVLEAKIPIEVTYPCKVQRIYVRSTGYDQRLGGSVLFDRLQIANTREIVEND